MAEPLFHRLIMKVRSLIGNNRAEPTSIPSCGNQGDTFHTTWPIVPTNETILFALSISWILFNSTETTKKKLHSGREGFLNCLANIEVELPQWILTRRKKFQTRVKRVTLENENETFIPIVCCLPVVATPGNFFQATYIRLPFLERRNRVH